MHDKNLKRFRISLRDLHPSLDASVSITRRQYPKHIQRATKAVLHKIEVFDRYWKIVQIFLYVKIRKILLRRYADLLANMEAYARLFVKNSNATGHVILTDKYDFVIWLFFF
jgi:hypothetical protein